MFTKKAYLSVPAEILVVFIRLFERVEGPGIQPRHEFQFEADVVLALRGLVGGLQPECAIKTGDVRQMLGTINREGLRTILGFIRGTLPGNEQAEYLIEFFDKLISRAPKKGDYRRKIQRRQGELAGSQAIGAGLSVILNNFDRGRRQLLEIRIENPWPPFGLRTHGSEGEKLVNG
jgi:hypothetical protein